MAGTKFWRRTAATFRRLQPALPRPGEVHRASHNGLCAWWKPGGWSDGKPYRFRNDGHDIKANRNIERLFKMAAESAEVELGHPGGEAAVFAWLDRLRLEGLYVKGASSGSRIIHRVCDASAEYCLKCETDAKAKARERKRTGASPGGDVPYREAARPALPTLPLEAHRRDQGRQKKAEQDSAPSPPATNAKNDEVSPDLPSPSKKKRGRPQTIPDEKKDAAQKIKNDRGTNRDAAIEIYDTEYPSPQQVKNVSSILRHHKQKSNQSGSSTKPRRTPARTRQTRG